MEVIILIIFEYFAIKTKICLNLKNYLFYTIHVWHFVVDKLSKPTSAADARASSHSVHQLVKVFFLIKHSFVLKRKFLPISCLAGTYLKKHLIFHLNFGGLVAEWISTLCIQRLEDIQPLTVIHLKWNRQEQLWKTNKYLMILTAPLAPWIRTVSDGLAFNLKSIQKFNG